MNRTRQESNLQPSVPKTDALSIELLALSAPDRTRTCDPMLRKHVLSPLSYGGVKVRPQA